MIRLQEEALSEYTADSIGDIDGTMAFIFHAPNKIKDALSSHELRFNGSFENFDLLAGYSINDRDLIFHECHCSTKIAIDY